MAELVDAHDSGSCGAICGGSSPPIDIIIRSTKCLLEGRRTPMRSIYRVQRERAEAGEFCESRRLEAQLGIAVKRERPRQVPLSTIIN